MKKDYIDSKKLFKTILIVVVVLLIAAALVRYVVYLCTYHQFIYEESYPMFVALDEQGNMLPSYEEEELDTETGIVTTMVYGSNKLQIEKAVITVKGELSTGSLHYILYGDNDAAVLDITLEAGVPYDEVYEVGYVGFTHNECYEFPVETRAKDEGIVITVTGMARGFTIDFGND